MTNSDGRVLGATQIHGSSPTSRTFNIVMLAEGFMDAEQDTFNDVCLRVKDAVLSTPPFTEFADSLTFVRINVSSVESGADDPSVGTKVRTYFDARFGDNDVQRLLVCDNKAAALVLAASHVPHYDLPLIVVNSTQYGGSGGPVCTISSHPNATEIALHESGHSAFGLADEYSMYRSEDEQGYERHPGFEPREPNVTVTTDRARLKWEAGVDVSTVLPTMSNRDCSTVDKRPSPVPVGTVGLFEGAHYYHCGAYRAEFDCKMRNLFVPFCRVCSDAIRGKLRSRIGGATV